MRHPLLLFPIAMMAGLCAPTDAWAHSFAIYVSTPLTPPEAFVWLWPISLLVIGGSICFSLRKYGGVGIVESVCVAIGVLLLFGGIFLFVGFFAAGLSTAPPPGLGPPGLIYRRWSGYGLVVLFVVWNAIGLTLLYSAIMLLGRLWKSKRNQHVQAIVRIPLLAYGAMLLPYLLTGAIAHGWGGGYVMMAGEDQLMSVNRACFLYAKDHEGRFPVAQDIEELMPQIQPYLKPRETRHGNPYTVHPGAWVFDEHPKSYVWDAAQSGKLAPRIERFNRVKLPVACPYVDRIDSVRLYDRYQDEFEATGSHD